MSRSAVAQTYGAAALDLADLRARILPSMALSLAVAGAVGAWYYLPAGEFQWQPSLLLAALALLGMAAWLLGRSSPLAGAITLVLGECLLATLTAWLLPGAEVLILCLTIVSASAIAWPPAQVGIAIASCLIQYAAHRFVQPQPRIELLLLIYLLLGWLLYQSARPLHGLLLWSWQRHTDALCLSEQLRDRQGELNATVKALDLAYRLLQRTNHELAEARLEAEEARRLREQFAASISHELRTPLNLILGFSEMMHLSPDIYADVNWTGLLRRDVAQIYSASRHLLQLVDDVLDLSRLNAERVPLRKELCSLEEIIREAVATVKGLARSHPVQIHAELDPTVPRLLVDGTRIRQAVLNLLNNAVRFTDQGEILVRTERTGDDVLISVQDSGVGIAPDELEKVFDEFYQADAAARGPSGGMGLGLAISRRFVQMHGGRIWAESTLGVGSTFRISLPLDANRPVTSRLRVSRAGPLPANPYGESVVLLGAQSDVARLLERHLGNCKVSCAADVAEAQRLVAGHHPRAVICNLSLANMRALTSELLPRDLPKSVPVLYCAIPCSSWRAEIMRVYGSLLKPVGRQELLSLLAGLQGARDVLVVDDDLGFVQVVTRILQGSNVGYRVRSALSGAEGLEEMRRCVPDAVLLDLRMPDMDGEAVLAAMRAEPSLESVPVIVVSAMDVQEEAGSLDTSLVALAQRADWRLEDTLKALDVLLQAARPSYAAEPAEAPGQLAPTIEAAG